MVQEKGARAGAVQRVRQRQNPHHFPTPMSGSGFLIFTGAHGRQMLEPPRRSSEEALHQMGLEPQDGAQPAPQGGGWADCLGGGPVWLMDMNSDPAVILTSFG